MSEIKNHVIVSVCMSTYNHELFIVEALNSVLKQECDFEFEVILSNDQSTDSTNDVILNFISKHPLGNKIKYYNQEKNLGINDNLIFTLERAKGKYIALLEGDDYWIDKTKLQKQFNFLEKHTDFTICTAAYETITQNEGYKIMKLDDNFIGKTYTFDKLEGFSPHYLNMFFIKKVLDINKLRNFNYSGDNVIFIMCLSKGKGYFFNQVFGFRREHENGAWSSKSLIERLKMGAEQFIGLYKFPEYKKAVRPILFYYYADLIDSDKKSLFYMYSSFKLIRKIKEMKYFFKKIFRRLLKVR